VRFNPFEKRGDDTIQDTPKNPLEVLVGPITRSRAKKLKDAYNGLI